MRKRKYTALPPGPVCVPRGRDDIEEDDGTPVPVIHNIVSTAQIQSTHMPLDLDTICEIIPGSSYDRRKFAAMTIRLANPSCTLLLFSSGKLVVTGGRNWYEGVLSCLSIARLLQRAHSGVDFWLKACDIQNIVAHVEIPLDGGTLDLESMYTRMNLYCMYQKNTFPGLIYRPEASPVVLLCFHSGKIVITGGRHIRDVLEGWRRLWPTVKVFVKHPGPIFVESLPDLLPSGTAEDEDDDRGCSESAGSAGTPVAAVAPSCTPCAPTATRRRTGSRG